MNKETLARAKVHGSAIHGCMLMSLSWQGDKVQRIRHKKEDYGKSSID